MSEMKVDERKTNQKYIAEKLGTSELLCQLAEEATELAQAALKYRRTLESMVNPTVIESGAAIDNLLEEAADVLLCMEVLDLDSLVDVIEGIEEKKLERWKKRLQGDLSE
jgi:NTP pyrophosphatase (non-canonical NTP hydrolase)